MKACKNSTELIQVLYPNGTKQYDNVDSTDGTYIIPRVALLYQPIEFSNINYIKYNLELARSTQPTSTALTKAIPPANRPPAHKTSRDTIATPDPNRFRTIPRTPQICSDVHESTPMSMTERWGVTLAETRPHVNSEIIIPPGIQPAREAFPYSNRRTANIGCQFLSHPQFPTGHAPGTSHSQHPQNFNNPDAHETRGNSVVYPVPQYYGHPPVPFTEDYSDMYQDGNPLPGLHVPFPQTHQPPVLGGAMILPPGQWDFPTPDQGGRWSPPASGGLIGLENIHMQTMYPHLVRPGGTFSYVTEQLNLAEKYAPAMKEPLLRAFLKDLTPTMVKILGGIIDHIQDEANHSTAEVGKFALSNKCPVTKKFYQIQTREQTEKYRVCVRSRLQGTRGQKCGIIIITTAGPNKIPPGSTVRYKSLELVGFQLN